MKGAFDGLPELINSGNIFLYLLLRARFHGRQCEGYVCTYDMFFRSLSRDKNVYTSVYDRSAITILTLWRNWCVV